METREDTQRRVTQSDLNTLQSSDDFKHLDVNRVYRKLRDRYNAVPTYAALVKWLSTETDARSVRRTELTTMPPRRSVYREDRTCQACDGTGFVKVIRKVNGVEVSCRAYTTYVDEKNRTQRKLVRCDHFTLNVDPHHGEEFTLDRASEQTRGDFDGV